MWNQPFYLSVVVTISVFFILILVLKDKAIYCSILSSLVAATALTGMMVSPNLWHFLNTGNFQGLKFWEAPFLLGVGLMLLKRVVPNFRYWRQDFWLCFGFFLFAYYAYCWTFNHVFPLWCIVIAFTVINVVVQLLFGGVATQGTSGRKDYGLGDLWKPWEYDYYD